MSSFIFLLPKIPSADSGFNSILAKGNLEPSGTSVCFRCAEQQTHRHKSQCSDELPLRPWDTRWEDGIWPPGYEMSQLGRWEAKYQHTQKRKVWHRQTDPILSWVTSGVQSRSLRKVSNSRGRGRLTCSEKETKSASGDVTLFPQITKGYEGPNSGATNLTLVTDESEVNLLTFSIKDIQNSPFPHFLCVRRASDLREYPASPVTFYWHHNSSK